MISVSLPLINKSKFPRFLFFLFLFLNNQENQTRIIKITTIVLRELNKQSNNLYKNSSANPVGFACVRLRRRYTGWRLLLRWSNNNNNNNNNNRKNYILSKKMKIYFLKKKLNLSHLYSTVKTLVTVKPFRTQPAGLNTETPAFCDPQLTIEMLVASYCTVINKVH